jgi:hypothetical protein
MSIDRARALNQLNFYFPKEQISWKNGLQKYNPKPEIVSLDFSKTKLTYSNQRHVSKKAPA